MKKISIIVPVYNAEKYIERCLKSILNQRYTNLEIIIVDDGSTDNSSKICIDYEKQYKNIIYVKKENEGPGPARNLGIRLASGDYIGFVDSDDFIHKDMYYNMIKELEKHDADIVEC